jgi:hypothetical protein
MTKGTEKQVIAELKQNPEMLRKMGHLLELACEFRLACLNWDACSTQANVEDVYEISRLGWMTVHQLQQDVHELHSWYPELSSLPLFNAPRPADSVEKTDENATKWLDEWGEVLKLKGVSSDLYFPFIEILKQSSTRERHDMWKDLQKKRRGLNQLYHAISDLSETLYQNTFDKIVDCDAETNPDLRLKAIHCSLKIFRHVFIKCADVKGPYNRKQRIFGHSDTDIGMSGTLTLHPGVRVVECSFDSPDSKDSGEVPKIPDFPVCGWKKYEEDLFSCWNYADGKNTSDSTTDEPAVWIIQDVAFFKNKAFKIKEYAQPLLAIDQYEQRVKSLLSVIRKWQSRKIEWTNIKELDDIIGEIELGSDELLKVAIHLKNFNRGESKKLLEDLIDSYPRGVIYQEERHGKNQPKTLKERLKGNGYEQVVKCLHIEKGTIYLKNMRLIRK